MSCASFSIIEASREVPNSTLDRAIPPSRQKKDSHFCIRHTYFVHFRRRPRRHLATMRTSLFVALMISMSATCFFVSIIGEGVNARELVCRFQHEGWTCTHNIHKATQAIVTSMPDDSMEKHAHLVVQACASLPCSCRSVCLVSSLTMYDALTSYDDEMMHDDTELKNVCAMELCESTITSLPPRIHTHIFRPNMHKLSASRVLSSSEQSVVATNVVNWLYIIHNV